MGEGKMAMETGADGVDEGDLGAEVDIEVAVDTEVVASGVGEAMADGGDGFYSTCYFLCMIARRCIRGFWSIR